MNNFIRDYLVKLYIPRITWTDIIEIVIIAFVIYNVMVWIKNTKAWVLLKGIIIVVIFALIAYILNLKTILWIAGKTISVGIIALVIIFQPELRRALEQLGRKKILFGLFRFNDGREKGERFSSKTAEEIVRACFDMGAAYTGALIVIEQDMVLEEYEKTGITVDGLVTSQLLINIFEHNTPLHDGAVIIRGDRVVAATCYLPLSDNNNLNKALGNCINIGIIALLALCKPCNVVLYRLSLYRIAFFCLLKVLFQHLCVCLLRQALVILPVIYQIVVCKQDVHGCSILCNLIGAKCTLLRRVHAAYKSIPRYTIRLIQACQKHYEKSHVIV